MFVNLNKFGGVGQKERDIERAAAEKSCTEHKHTLLEPKHLTNRVRHHMDGPTPTNPRAHHPTNPRARPASTDHVGNQHGHGTREERREETRGRRRPGMAQWDGGERASMDAEAKKTSAGLVRAGMSAVVVT